MPNVYSSLQSTITPSTTAKTGASNALYTITTSLSSECQVTVVSTGRPILLILEQMDVIGGSSTGVTATSVGGTSRGSIACYRGATLIGFSGFGVTSNNATKVVGHPWGDFRWIDINPPTGSLTYSLTITAIGGATLSIAKLSMRALAFGG